MAAVVGIAWRRLLNRRLTALLLLVLSACTPDPTPATGAVFVIEVIDERFRVLLTRYEAVQEARELMESGESRVLVGRLVGGSGGFNLGYSWHLEPDSVGFHDVAMELCDGLPSYVEQNLGYWLDTVGTYCPWQSRVVAEVQEANPSLLRSYRTIDSSTPDDWTPALLPALLEFDLEPRPLRLFALYSRQAVLPHGIGGFSAGRRLECFIPDQGWGVDYRAWQAAPEHFCRWCGRRGLTIWPTTRSSPSVPEESSARSKG